MYVAKIAFPRLKKNELLSEIVVVVIFASYDGKIIQESLLTVYA